MLPVGQKAKVSIYLSDESSEVMVKVTSTITFISLNRFLVLILKIWLKVDL